jgi:PAS domain S-box-containing protein
MVDRARVYVVEDDNIIAMGIQARLEDLGYGVAGHDTRGECAVQSIWQTSPDLVLMDIRLRGEIDGIETARRVHEEMDVPIIYLTAYTDAETLERAKLSEPYGYLVKPFQERELHTTIEMALYKHRMERRLKDREQWLATVLGSIGDGVIAADSDLRIVFMNAAAAALTRYVPADVLGIQLDKVFRVVSGTGLRTAVDRSRSLHTGDHIAAEAVVEDQDGFAFPVDYSIVAIQSDPAQGWVLAFRDTTARKRAEQEIAHRLAQTETLRDVMLSASSTLDFDQVLERTVATLQRRMGLDLIGFVLPDGRKRELQLHASQVGFDVPQGGFTIPLNDSVTGHAFRTGETILVTDVQACPFYFTGANGVCSELAIPVRVGSEVRGVLDLESRCLGTLSEESIGFYEAIAGQLSIALENARLYQEIAEHADVLAETLNKQLELDRLKTELIQNVSHELRTPITLISGYAAMLADGELGPLNAQQQRAADVAARRSVSLKNLVQDILLILLTERQVAEPGVVSLAELTRAALEDFELPLRESDLSLQAEIQPDLATVCGGVAELRRVLDNLLSNAVKFNRPGGEVRVSLFQSGAEVILKVTDTGIGIPASQHDRIFDRFYQVDGSSVRRYGGTGIGLSLVKEVVEARGGTVAVNSEPGVGSTFTVSLPICSRDGMQTDAGNRSLDSGGGPQSLG